MSSEWPMLRLGDHVDACLGKMLDAKKNKGTPQPYLGNSNVRWGEFDLDALAEMRFETHEEERYSLQPGDLVICEGGEPGRCAIWQGLPGMKIQKALHRIRPKSAFNNYYLFYWFSLAARNGTLEPHFTGTTIKHLTGKAIAALEVPAPPVDTQIAMVDVLRSLDDRITLLRETNATLEAIAQALFKSWFVDFDPVRAKQAGRAPEGMSDATAALFPDSFEESELGLVPKGWRVGALGDVLALRNERTKPSDETKALPYVPIESISAKVPFLQEYKSGEEANSSLILFRKGDILFGAMRPYFHKVCTAPFDGVTRTTVFTLKSINPDASGFALFLAFQEATIEYATQHSEGSTIPYAKWGKSLECMPIIVPPESVQIAFSEIVSSFIECANENIEQAQTLATLRDTLLPRLISGQLRLPEAEALIEDAV